MQEQNVNCTRESRRFLLGVPEIVQSMFLYIHGVDYVTHDQTSTATCAAGSVQNWTVPVPAWHSCRCPKPYLLSNWTSFPWRRLGREKTSWAQSPPLGSVAAAPAKHNPTLVRRAPGGWVTSRYHRAEFVASPLPAVVLHLLSEAEVVLPVSLF